MSSRRPLTLVLAGALIAGCGGNKEASGPETEASTKPATTATSTTSTTTRSQGPSRVLLGVRSVTRGKKPTEFKPRVDVDADATAVQVRAVVRGAQRDQQLAIRIGRRGERHIIRAQIGDAEPVRVSFSAPKPVAAVGYPCTIEPEPLCPPDKTSRDGSEYEFVIDASRAERRGPVVLGIALGPKR